MPQRVRITDVSPRDGLQNEPGVVPAPDKARLIHLLTLAGLDEIEATSLVSPRWVPQLADAEDVITAIAQSPPARRPLYSALIPNAAGFERLESVHARVGRRVIQKISVFTAASETFSRRNTNATIEEALQRFYAFLPGAMSDGYAVRAYISCAVRCPFEGPIAPEAVRRVADSLLAIAPRPELIELDLGDTIGVATPHDIRALLSVFSAPEIAALTLHLHDTFGRAADCVAEALALGVRSFDASVAGLGGCPYAGTKERPAPGNIATETLLGAVNAAGFTTGVSPEPLARAAEFARDAVARARASATGLAPAPEPRS